MQSVCEDVAAMLGVGIDHAGEGLRDVLDGNLEQVRLQIWQRDWVGWISYQINCCSIDDWDEERNGVDEPALRLLKLLEELLEDIGSLVCG